MLVMRETSVGYGSHLGSVVNGTRVLVKPIVRHARGLTTAVATQLVTLATSALGLVAALAWNDAVQSLFKEWLPATGGVVAKFLYAVVISVAVLVLTINLTKIAQLAKNGVR